MNAWISIIEVDAAAEFQEYLSLISLIFGWYGLKISNMIFTWSSSGLSFGSWDRMIHEFCLTLT
jgi:hypothetical protein